MKVDKGQKMIRKTQHRKLTIEKHETGGELGCSERVSSYCSTSGTHRVTLDKNPMTSP